MEYGSDQTAIVHHCSGPSKNSDPTGGLKRKVDAKNHTRFRGYCQYWWGYYGLIAGRKFE